ncbi:hypothetical protein PPSIR1_30716 [Plesiocystis pacifica SIR-1]|uniref:ATP synthase protein I n=1 Tax=Plesiocystis pacifica SIR-1 TaxID=391625 RepID=A6GAF6_9BACT|nr:AtpZ/AtpI family protein [Plesiocystis pacifica]EDM77144.1 hypothetical protein PPSIR1_30716 [Plesiocystis pacifica SIR-1]
MTEPESKTGDTPEPIDEERHAELVKKHVYGNPDRRAQFGRAAWFHHSNSASVGIEICVSIVLFTLLGMWLENNYTHWSPWTMLIGLAVGMGAAVNAVARTIRDTEREIAQREAKKAAAEAAAADAGPDEPGEPS